jgi:hypothetical protein
MENDEIIFGNEINPRERFKSTTVDIVRPQ